MSKLTDKTVKSFAMAKVFKNNEAKTGKINSMDYFPDGELLITGSDDESIHVYNCQDGVLNRVVYSKKYGVDLVRFTHVSSAVICASKNRWDESLRYLSLHDNRYLRYFKGHREKVISLSLCPKNDQFLSSSLDETVRLWDLRTNACQGLLKVKGRTLVNYDPQGLIFATASANNTVKLFDNRSYDKGPFSTFQVPHIRPVEWASMKFSPDGKYVLLAANENVIFLVDSFSGSKLRVFNSHANENSYLEASFSPDGQFISSGGEDGIIHIWSATTGEEKSVLPGHAGPVTTTEWNPRYQMLASSCSNLVFWLPDEESAATF